uniref:Uncharacterized protein n=1 Tax=Trichogramma kaykai TaxID=54128 RepID=A0ABD2XJF6_9HYME
MRERHSRSTPSSGWLQKSRWRCSFTESRSTRTTGFTTTWLSSFDKKFIRQTASTFVSIKIYSNKKQTDVHSNKSHAIGYICALLMQLPKSRTVSEMHTTKKTRATLYSRSVSDHNDRYPLKSHHRCRDRKYNMRAIVVINLNFKFKSEILHYETILKPSQLDNTFALCKSTNCMCACKCANVH